MRWAKLKKYSIYQLVTDFGTEYALLYPAVSNLEAPFDWLQGFTGGFLAVATYKGALVQSPS